MGILKESPGALLLLMDEEIFYDSSLDSDVIWLLFNYKFKRPLKISDEKGNIIEKPNIEVDIIVGKCESDINTILIEPSDIRRLLDSSITITESDIGKNMPKCQKYNIRPRLDFIIAIEVKCSRYDYNEENEEKKLKAHHGDDEQEGIRKQLHDRLKMGFDRVSLLDILFTNPGTGNGIWASFNASDKINNVHDKMEKDSIFENRLAHESQGHYIFKKGSVKKDEVNEFLNGSGRPTVRNKSKPNPFLKDEDTKYNRKIIEEVLNKRVLNKQVSKKDSSKLIYIILK